MRTTILLFFVILMCSLTGLKAQQGCDSKVIPYKAMIAGQTDSVTVALMLQARKIESVNKAFEILSFNLSWGGACTKTDEGLPGTVPCESAVFTPQIINVIKRFGPDQKFYLECVKVRNRIGQVYYLKPQTMKIRKGA